MDTPKRKAKRKPRAKKFKDNVTYLDTELNDVSYGSPTTTLEAVLDDYRSKRRETKKIMILFLEENGSFDYAQNNLTLADFIILSSRMEYEANKRLADGE